VKSFSGDGFAPVCVIQVRPGGVARTRAHNDTVLFLGSSLMVVRDKGEVIA
jgi:hypothetical protein